MPSDATSSGTSPVRRVSGRKIVRKWVLLGSLIVALAALGYGTYYFQENRTLPIPGIAPAAEAVAPPTYLFSITGAGANELKNPVGVGVGSDGRVYAVDFDNRRISVFDQNGRYLFSFNKLTDGKETALRSPVHLAVAKDGTVWVSDRRLRGIYIFSPEGKFVRKFLPNGDANFKWTPLALTFDSAGALRATNVGETQKHEVIYFDTAGNVTKRFGRTVQVANPAAEPGTFYFPNGITVAANGDVYVSDGDNQRVQVFDDQGTFKQFVATSGVPRGIVIDTEDRLYVVDALAHQIDMYNLTGESLVQFGERGFGPGQFNYPNDIALFQNRIFITDRGNDQVQVWGWPTGGLPPVRLPSTPLGWLFCLSPLLLLPLLLILRRRRFTVTEDFVDAMVALGQTSMLAERRFRFVVPEPEHEAYVGRVEDGVDLGATIEPEPYSDSDARSIAQRLEVDEPTAILLAVAGRTKGLCTQDDEVRRLARALEIDVFNAHEFIATYARKKRGSGSDAASPPGHPGNSGHE